MEGHVLDAARLGAGEIAAAGEAAIGGHLTRGAPKRDVALEYGRSRSRSAGLPASMTRSGIRPLLPAAVRLSL